MNLKPILFLLLVVRTTTLFSQERIETDRPDQTETPYIVPAKWFQGEVGFNWLQYKSDLRTLMHPTLLSKYGISKIFELRLITEWASVETPLLIPAGNKIETGLLPVQLGGKLALSEEKGLRPKTSFIFHMAIPKAASPEFQRSRWAPNFRFTMQHSLSQDISLGYNLGAEWDGEESAPTYIYTLAPGFTFDKKWYGYLELFGFLNKDDHPQHSFDGGLAYYTSADTKIDLSAGFGLTPNTHLKQYVALGFSFRFH